MSVPINPIGEIELELNGTVIMGPRGPAGKDGNDGNDGRDGTDGNHGKDGNDGLPGLAGLPGKSAYQTWLDLGNIGSEADFLVTLRGVPGLPGNDGDDGEDGDDGQDGREIELRSNGTHVQWRYLGDADWTDIVEIASLRGPKGEDGTDGSDGNDGTNGSDGSDGQDGADGREVQLQKNTTHIQWRYVGTSVWSNLVPLSDIKGEAGTGLTNRGSFVPNAEYNPSDYVFAEGTSAPTSMFISQADAAFEAILAPKDDPTNWVEFSAPAGQDGQDGRDGVDGNDGSPGVAGSDGIDGTDGREVELQVTETHVQWRLAGESWQNLITLLSLKGADGKDGDPGADGIDGTNGSDGRDGVDGEDGANGSDGVSPNLSIGTVSTLAPGATATATLTGDFPDLALNLGIPRGAKGDPGEDGTGGEGSYDGPVIDVPTAAGKVLMSGNTPPGSTYWGDPPAGGGSISPPVAGDAGKVLTAGDDLGTTYWATPSGGGGDGGSGPVIPMNAAGDVGKVLLAGATEGSTYWGSPPTGGYPVPTAPDAGKFLRAGAVLGTAYWDDPPSGGGSGGLPALVNNAGKFLSVNTLEDGVEWVDPPAGGGGGGDSSLLKAMRATDMTNQTLTLQPVLGVNVVGGRQYLMRFMAMTRPTTLTQGMRIGFLGTFGNSNMQILGSYRGTAGALTQRTAVAKADVMVFPNHEKGNDGNLLILEGLVHVSAAGTFQIGFSVDTEWDYCALVKGASLTLQDMGALAV